MKRYKPLILAGQSLSIMGIVLMSPVLPAIEQEFPEAGSVAIQMLVTLPAICSLVTTQLSGWASCFMDKRPLILTGLFIFACGGIGGFFIREFWQLFVCRILVGVGMGIYGPVNLSLVSDFYEGDARTGTIGLAQAMNYLGGTIGTMVGGLLALTNWRNVFLVNIFAAVVFVVDLIFLPSYRMRTKKEKKKLPRLPAKAFLYSLCAGGQMLIFYACVTNFAVRVQEIGESSSFYASIGITCLYVGCFLTGLVLIPLKRLLKKWLIEVSIAATAAGFLLLFCVPHLWALYLGVFLVGLGDGAIIPSIMSYTADVCAKEITGRAMATVNLGVSIGQFASPLFFAFICTVMAEHTTESGFRGLFYLMLAVTAAGAAAILYRQLRHKAAGPDTGNGKGA